MIEPSTPLRLGAADLAVHRRAHGAEAAGIGSREFGAQKKHLGRIVYPHQYDDERPCCSVCIRKARLAEFRAEFFNILNLTAYANQGVGTRHDNPTTTGAFGNSTTTPDAGDKRVLPLPLGESSSFGAQLNNGYTQKPKRRLWAVRSAVTGFRGGPHWRVAAAGDAVNSHESPILGTTLQADLRLAVK